MRAHTHTRTHARTHTRIHAHTRTHAHTRAQARALARKHMHTRVRGALRLVARDSAIAAVLRTHLADAAVAVAQVVRDVAEALRVAIDEDWHGPCIWTRARVDGDVGEQEWRTEHVCLARGTPCRATSRAPAPQTRPGASGCVRICRWSVAGPAMYHGAITLHVAAGSAVLV